MKIDNIRLSFDDTQKRISRHSDTTTATVRTYFSQMYFDRVFGMMGFTQLPPMVTDTLKKYGYSYDYRLGGWAKTVSATIRLQEGDTDDPVKAANIAKTKVKALAYRNALKCVWDIANRFFKASDALMDSSLSLNHIMLSEDEAFERCKETGYCDPKRK